MGKLLGLFIWIKVRLLEPSTHASLSAVCAMIGVNLDDGAINDWINVLTLVFGALGFFISEEKPLTNI